MSYIRPRRFSRATSEMHARSRHHSDRHPRTCCEDPWQAQAPSLTMDPRVKPEGDSAGVWRDRVAISPVVRPGLEQGIQGKRSRGGEMVPRAKHTTETRRVGEEG